MQRRSKQLIAALALALLAGCAKEGDIKPGPPLPVRQYVKVPPELTKRCEWPKNWPKRRVLESNAVRGACLIQYEGQMDGIEKLKP